LENKRVVEIIQAGMAWANWTSEQKEAMLIALEAVKKQIPQKVIKTEKSSQACPVCHHNVSWNYCPNCAQKISY